jgi:hypothetical protein
MEDLNVSYIEKVLNGGQSNTTIVDFLLKEGFKYGTGAMGEGSMYYVASSSLYSVWFALCEDHISLHAEYDCGGEVGSDQCHFKEDDFESFMEAYEEAVDWAKGYIK